MSMRDQETCVHCGHDLSKAEQINGLCDVHKAKGYKPRSYYETAECHYVTCGILVFVFIFFGVLMLGAYYDEKLNDGAELLLYTAFAFFGGAVLMLFMHIHYELVTPHTEEADRNKVATHIA